MNLKILFLSLFLLFLLTACDSATSGQCGDGIIQEESGEVCDEVETGTASCSDVGKWGNVTCSSDCKTVDYSNCDGIMRMATHRYGSINAHFIDKNGNVVVSGHTGGNIFGHQNENQACIRHTYLETAIENGQPVQYGFYCLDTWMAVIDSSGNQSASNSISTMGEDLFESVVRGINDDYFFLTRLDMEFPTYEAVATLGYIYENGNLRISHVSSELEILSSIDLQGFEQADTIITLSENSVLLGPENSQYHEVNLQTGEITAYDFPVYITPVYLIEENYLLVYDENDGSMKEFNFHTGDLMDFFSCSVSGPSGFEPYVGPFTSVYKRIQSYDYLIDHDGNFQFYCHGESPDPFTEVIYTVTKSGTVLSQTDVTAKYRQSLIYRTKSGKFVYKSYLGEQPGEVIIERICNFEQCDQFVLSISENGTVTNYVWNFNRYETYDITGISVHSETVWISGIIHPGDDFSSVGFLIKKSLD